MSARPAPKSVERFLRERDEARVQLAAVTKERDEARKRAGLGDVPCMMADCEGPDGQIAPHPEHSVDLVHVRVVHALAAERAKVERLREALREARRDSFESAKLTTGEFNEP